MRRLVMVTLFSLLTPFSSFAQNPNNFVVQSSCGPKLLVQVPVPGRNYNGPTVLEGDVFEAGTAVKVTVDGQDVPVTLVVMNPGPKQFWRWATPKLKTKGPHVAVITATNATGSTQLTSQFKLAIAK